jgi:catechol 2,3-dioxygenase-like lactoylglutathione lyase family enzyme
MPGLSHITFVVRDLERTAALFLNVLGAREVYRSGDRPFSLSRERFFLVGDVWICAMEGEPLSVRTYNHVAFSVPEKEFDEYARRVADAGAEVLSGRARVPGEGRSIYFYDFDNHLFEIHAGSLKERLACYSTNS